MWGLSSYSELDTFVLIPLIKLSYPFLYSVTSRFFSSLCTFNLQVLTIEKTRSPIQVFRPQLGLSDIRSLACSARLQRQQRPFPGLASFQPSHSLLLSNAIGVSAKSTILLQGSATSLAIRGASEKLS